MNERINTILLVLILVAVLWIGFSSRGPTSSAGQYTAFRDDHGNVYVMNTSNGELHSLGDPENSFGVFHMNLPKDEIKVNYPSVEEDPRVTEAKRHQPEGQR